MAPATKPQPSPAVWPFGFPAPLCWQVVVVWAVLNLLLMILSALAGEKSALWLFFVSGALAVLAGELSLLALAVGFHGFTPRSMPGLAVAIAAWTGPLVLVLAVIEIAGRIGGDMSIGRFIEYAITEYGYPTANFVLAGISLALPVAIARVLGVSLTRVPDDGPKWPLVALGIDGAALAVLALLALGFGVISLGHADEALGGTVGVVIGCMMGGVVVLFPVVFLVLRAPSGVIGLLIWQGCILACLLALAAILLVMNTMANSMRSGGSAQGPDLLASLLVMVIAFLGFTLTVGLPLLFSHMQGTRLEFDWRRVRFWQK
jgi:hypothetical protein